MKIVFDEEKVRRDGKYDIEKMYASIDKAFDGWGIPKIDRGVYQTKGLNSDYTNFMSFCMGMRRVSWFMEYIDKWIWEKGNSFEDVKRETLKYARIYGRL